MESSRIAGISTTNPNKSVVNTYSNELWNGSSYHEMSWKAELKLLEIPHIHFIQQATHVSIIKFNCCEQICLHSYKEETTVWIQGKKSNKIVHYYFNRQFDGPFKYKKSKLIACGALSVSEAMTCNDFTEYIYSSLD